MWQWGRRGAGPLLAAAMARGLAQVPGVETVLSLSTAAELLDLPRAPVNDLPIRTYRSRLGFAGRLLRGPLLMPRLVRGVLQARVDVALCAMPAPLDLVMATALRRAGVPFGVVVHDAQLHPGEAFPLQMPLQRLLLRRAKRLVVLTRHVGEQLRGRPELGVIPMVQASLPPFVFGPMPRPVRTHGGPLRLLSFGRLLPYKGLDVLADAIERLPAHLARELRVVGSGPESGDLARLRSLPGVTVENRWVPEAELGALLAWADVLVLTHKEASQSGVAAAAMSVRRWVVATRVGGLEEQVGANPMGVLCQPDGDSVANAVASLLDRPLPLETPEPDWRRSAEVIAQALRELTPEQTMVSGAEMAAL